MSITITVLCENTATFGTRTIGEHGFSAFIETETGNFLFDTGGGNTLMYNATILRKDLRTTNKLLLSHSHYDHTGGLLSFLQFAGPTEVIVHPDLFVDRFVRRVRAGVEVEIPSGIPFSKEYITRMGAQFTFIENFYEIENGFFATGEVPRITHFENGDPNFYMNREDKTEKDNIIDDLSLVFDTKKGFIIVCGCAHAGLINIITHIKNTLGNRNIYALVGGTHLGLSSREQREETIKLLKEYHIEKFLVSHCTGINGMFRLYDEFGDNVLPATAGTVMKFDGM